MDGAAIKAWIVAALLAASSCVAFVVGWFERFDPADFGGALFDWSFLFLGWFLWEYVGCALFVAAAGCAIAAFRLNNQ